VDQMCDKEMVEFIIMIVSRVHGEALHIGIEIFVLEDERGNGEGGNHGEVPGRAASR